MPLEYLKKIYKEENRVPDMAKLRRAIYVQRKYFHLSYDEIKEAFVKEYKEKDTPSNIMDLLENDASFRDNVDTYTNNDALAFYEHIIENEQYTIFNDLFIVQSGSYAGDYEIKYSIVTTKVSFIKILQ